MGAQALFNMNQAMMFYFQKFQLLLELLTDVTAAANPEAFEIVVKEREAMNANANTPAADGPAAGESDPTPDNTTFGPRAVPDDAVVAGETEPS
jgi:hypothetical protein